MATGGRNFHGAFHRLLPTHIAKVHVELVLPLKEFLARVNLSRRNGRWESVQQIHHLLYVTGSVHLQPVHHRRFAFILQGHNQSLIAHLACHNSYGKRTAYGQQGTVETEFAHHHILTQTVVLDFIGRSQYAYGYR